jgi:hypothetical protein
MYEYRVPSPRVVVRHTAVHCSSLYVVVELVGGKDTFTIDRLLNIFRVFGMLHGAWHGGLSGTIAWLVHLSPEVIVLENRDRSDCCP